MGKDLYEEFDYVREIFEMAEETAKMKLSKLCFEGPMPDLTLTVNLQPAVTTINLAFLAVLEKEGRLPDVSAGHSLGEFSALAAAGITSREDTLAMVFKRGTLMHRESTKYEGAMTAIVGLSMEEVQERYIELVAKPEKALDARHLRPLHERQQFGRHIFLYDNADREKLKPLGELYTPSVADLFVAKMKGGAS